jgi:hypothetical protein
LANYTLEFNQTAESPIVSQRKKSDSDFWSGERWGWIARILTILADRLDEENANLLTIALALIKILSDLIIVDNVQGLQVPNLPQRTTATVFCWCFWLLSMVLELQLEPLPIDL